MSEPIYSDKDYLDAQFGAIHLALSELKTVPTRLAVMETRQDNHDKSHTRFRKVGLTIVGLILTGLGLISRFTS